jgi:nitrite reductase (NADH) large subunit
LWDLIKTNQWEFVHMRKKKLVMVGNGMAGVRTLEELLKIAPEQYEITVFGAEPHPNYNRILLSPVLAGEMTIQDIILNDHSWYAQHGITLHLGKKVSTIDRVQAPGHRRRRHRSDLRPPAAGDRFQPVHPAGSRQRLAGVISYRDISDTDAMIDAARRYRHAVVIGGGLLGLEAANGLKLRGMDVTVVHLADWLLERQLDQTAGRMLQKSLEDRGLKFLLGKQTEMLIAGESGRVAAIRLKDGLQIPADLVVMAVGIRPNTRWPSRRASTASAASWSTTPCRPTTRKSTPSANVSPTAASLTDSSRRFSSRARSRPTIWRTTASAAIPAR